MSEFITRTPESVISDAYEGERVTLHCAKHHYFGEGDQTPTVGCKECAQVQLMLIFCRKKGDKQAALDELEALIHALCELDDEGSFDYTPDLHIHTETLKD